MKAIAAPPPPHPLPHLHAIVAEELDVLMEHVKHEPLQPEPVEAPGIWIISDAALHQRSTVREVLCA